MNHKNSLEVFVVDDEEFWRAKAVKILCPKGYLVETAHDSYNAIHALAGRLHLDKMMPDIYLCDMLDRNCPVAKIEVREWDQREMKNIYLAMAFNLYNYLTSQEIKPNFFIASTASISNEDVDIGRSLGIPIIDKMEGFGPSFPDVQGLSREEALKRFRENYEEKFHFLLEQNGR